jgi:hypothetical protein
MARGGGEGNEPISFSLLSCTAAHEQRTWRPVPQERLGLTR